MERKSRFDMGAYTGFPMAEYVSPADVGAAVRRGTEEDVPPVVEHGAGLHHIADMPVRGQFDDPFPADIFPRVEDPDRADGLRPFAVLKLGRVDRRPTSAMSCSR